jgi:hypothetical protein
MVDFSVVTLIKDENELIPLTLPSYYALKPREVVLCFDKPAPEDTLEITKKVIEVCGGEEITKIIEVARNPEYAFHQANIRRTGFRNATQDIILTGDIDLILDPRIRDYIRYLSVAKDKVGLISFNKIGYPPTFRLALANLIAKFYRLKGKHGFTGLYCFSKRAWLETEDLEHLKRQTTRGEDTHLHHYMKKKYNSRFIMGLKNYCLRPMESRQYQIMQGANTWTTRKTPLWRFLISTILYIRPYALIGYLQARYGLLRRFAG